MNIVGIVFHWSAGRYDQVFNDYHYNVTFDPENKCAKVVKSCKHDSDKKAHTWRRNEGRIGIALCCAYNATSENLGSFPPTDEQIEKACALAGSLAHTYSIKSDEIKSHAEWASIDGYGPGSGDPETRWDLWVTNWKNKGKNLSNVMRDKTLWYKENYVSHLNDEEDLYKPMTVMLHGNRQVKLPSIFKVVQEAHLVTKEDSQFANSWPQNEKDMINMHYKNSEEITGYKMNRGQPWCPSGEGNCEHGQGSDGKPSIGAETWYMCMYWENPPVPGTKIIIRNPANGRKVVAAAGYETGPSSPPDCLGGACEEIHHYLGSKHMTKLEVGFAKNQELPFGPLEN